MKGILHTRASSRMQRPGRKLAAPNVSSGLGSPDAYSQQRKVGFAFDEPK